MKFIIDILRGVVIGIANVIPDVSGGTLAVSMGIYDKIITSVNNLFKKFKQSIKTLLPYGIGIVLGIIGLSFAISFLFNNYPLPTVMLFSSDAEMLIVSTYLKECSQALQRSPTSRCASCFL